LRILPSLTAITGEPCLAKMFVPRLPSLLIATDALPVVTWLLASLVTELSAYLARAATGKCPSTSPVSVPISWLGIPPTSLARRSTDWTYHQAWL